MAYIDNIEQYLDVAKTLKLNVVLVGAHGRAKTAYMNKYASNNGYELYTKILSQFEPTDFIGLPSTSINEDGVEVTSNLHPDWLVAACDENKKVMLFFDEFNNGDVDVQASILNLIEDRKSNGLELAESTMIVMACNPPEIAPNARRISKALRDRLCMIPIVDNTQSYQDYYKSTGKEIIAELLNDIPDLIENYDEVVKKYSYENAEFTYRSLEKAYDIVNYCIDKNISDSVMFDMVCGYGGRYGNTVAKRIKDDIKDQKKNNAFTEILKSGSYEKINDYFNKNIEKFNDMGFADIVNFVNKAKYYMAPDDFEKLLENRFSQEFIEAYKEESE